MTLQPAEAGEAHLRLRVLDPDGTPVDGARVSLDGKVVGTTGNLGVLNLEGLAEGARELEVRAPLMVVGAPVVLTLGPGLRDVTVPMSWRPGAVEVLVRGPDGPVPDAVVRFSSERSGSTTLTERPPEGLGPSGVRRFELAPGTWRATISSSLHGIQRRTLTVAPEELRLLVVDTVLYRTQGEASLNLRVTDPDGRPVDGALVRIDGVEVGSTANSGALELAGLSEGERRVGVESALHLPFERVITVDGPGSALEASLAWRPGLLDLAVRGPEGPVDAAAMFSGRERLAPVRLGADGEHRFMLEPGAWRVVVSAAELGARKHDFQLSTSPEPTRLDLELKPVAVDARLVLRIEDPEGQAVLGAVVRVGERAPERCDGLLLVDGVAGERPRVQVEAPGFETFEIEDLNLAAGEQERLVELVWRPRSLKLVVQDEAGRTQPAQIRIQAARAGAPPGELRELAPGAEPLTLLPGYWQVLVEAEGFAPNRVDVRLLPGEAVQMATVTLKRPRVLVESSALTVSSQIRFHTGEAGLSPEAFDLLAEVAAQLTAHPEVRQLTIIGHTDDVGSEMYNLDLSRRRAAVVEAWLTEHGIDPERLAAEGYGASRPVVQNDSEGNRARIRRVEFVIGVPEAP